MTFPQVEHIRDPRFQSSEKHNHDNIIKKRKKKKRWFKDVALIFFFFFCIDWKSCTILNSLPWNGLFGPFLFSGIRGHSYFVTQFSCWVLFFFFLTSSNSLIRRSLWVCRQDGFHWLSGEDQTNPSQGHKLKTLSCRRSGDED